MKYAVRTKCVFRITCCGITGENTSGYFLHNIKTTYSYIEALLGKHFHSFSIILTKSIFLSAVKCDWLTCNILFGVDILLYLVTLR